MHEKVKILCALQQEENNVINSNNEVFGACRHKTKFHRFLKDDKNVKSTSTDEGNKPERVCEDKSTCNGTESKKVSPDEQH